MTDKPTPLQRFIDRAQPAEITSYEWTRNNNPRAIVWWREQTAGIFGRRQWLYLHEHYSRKLFPKTTLVTLTGGAVAAAYYAWKWVSDHSQQRTAALKRIEDDMTYLRRRNETLQERISTINRYADKANTSLNKQIPDIEKARRNANKAPLVTLDHTKKNERLTVDVIYDITAPDGDLLFFVCMVSMITKNNISECNHTFTLQ
jgi:hypothetical protein